MRVDLTRSHFNNDISNPLYKISNDESTYKSSSNIKLKNCGHQTAPTSSSSSSSSSSNMATISSEEAIRLSGLVAKTRALFESNNSK